MPVATTVGADRGADTLGLAVNTNDGEVYVIEDAHELYPKVYEKRYDGLSIQISGKVLKRKGNSPGSSRRNCKC